LMDAKFNASCLFVGISQLRVVLHEFLFGTQPIFDAVAVCRARDPYSLKASCAISSCVGEKRRPVYFAIIPSPVLSATTMSATPFRTLCSSSVFLSFLFTR
jgi:hypothetical protein